MFKHARRFRVVAALGLVLALAHGRAWGQEPIWTKAAKLVGCIWKMPQFVTPKQPPAEEQYTPLFAWEKKDAAEWHRGMAEFFEGLGEPRAVYFHYKILSRLFPKRKEFAEAAERQRPFLWQSMPVLILDEVLAPPSWNDGDSPILNPPEDQPSHTQCISRTIFFSLEKPSDNPPVTDEPPGAIAEESKVQTGPLRFGGGVQSDANLNANAAREEPSSLFLALHPAKAGSVVFVSPQWKDMLPDSERSRILVQLGVIVDPTRPAPQSEPPPQSPFEFWINFFH